MVPYMHEVTKLVISHVVAVPQFSFMVSFFQGGL